MRRQDYLKFMQVESFRLRKQHECKLTNVYCYREQNKTLLLAEGAGTSEEAALLARIIAALKLPLQGKFESVCDLNQFERIAQTTIYLGCPPESVQQKFSGHSLIVTHSLQAMLDNAEVKREVWASLRPVMQVH